MLTEEHRPADRGSNDPAPSSVLVDSNFAPASFDAVSVLADDTIMIAPVDIKPDASLTAMFTNPFSGAEEILKVDSTRTLRWLHKPAGVVSEGWVDEPVDVQPGATPAVNEVAVVVHPSGKVYAFVSISSGHSASCLPMLLALGEDGQPTWEPATPAAGIGAEAFQLFVYYRGVDQSHRGIDRPPNPTVVAVDARGKVHCWGTLLTGPGDWWHRTADLGGNLDLAACGVTVDPHSTDPNHQLQVVFYALTPAPGRKLQKWVLTTSPPSVIKRWETLDSVLGVVGLWDTPVGPGVVYAMPSSEDPEYTTELRITHGAESSASNHGTVRLSKALRQLELGQDAAGRLHVYGIDADHQLHVLHQVGWKTRDGFLYPAWEGQGTAGPSVASVRPLVGDVFGYVVDPYPDLMPAQQVQHRMPDFPALANVIYMQQVGTSYWSEELIRVAQDPARRELQKVTRFQTTLTLKDAFGNPIPNAPIEITTDAPVDVEVNGRFVRPGPTTVTLAMTDYQGRVRIKTLADEPAPPNIHVSAKTLQAGLTFNQADGVHKFLAGIGTLPTHREGFTAAAVKNARTAAGDYVFPNLVRSTEARPGAGDPVPLSPEGMVLECAQVFRIASGQPLLPMAVEGEETPQSVVGCATQTWDPSRPAHLAFRSEEELEAYVAELRGRPEYAGRLDPLYEWVGDVFQALEDGILAVTSTVPSSAGRSVEIFFDLSAGLNQSVVVSMDSGLAAYRACLGTMRQAEARSGDLVDWLKWAFDFTAVLQTKDVFLHGLAAVVPILSDCATNFIGSLDVTFFKDHATQIKDDYTGARAAFANAPGMPSLSDKQPTPPAIAQSPTDPFALTAESNPFVNWFWDQLRLWPADEPSPFVPLDPDLESELVEVLGAGKELIDGILRSDTQTSRVDKAVAPILAALQSLDLSDPSLLANVSVVDVLGLADTAILGMCQLTDSLVSWAIGLLEAWAACLADLLSVRIAEGTWAMTIWEFIASEVGLRPPPTMGDFFGLAGAYPATVMFQALTGACPIWSTFPSLAKPAWPKLGGAPGLSTSVGADPQENQPPPSYEVSQEWQYNMQMMSGFWTLSVQNASDLYANPATEEYLARGGRGVPMALGVAGLGFLVWDYPTFWGVQKTIPEDNWYEYLWYTIWTTKGVVSFTDLFLAIGLPVMDRSGTTEPTIMATYVEGLGNLLVTALAVIEVVQVQILMWSGRRRPMDTIWWLTMNLTLFSSLTAFLRYRMRDSPRLLKIKAGADIVCNSGTALWWFFMPFMSRLDWLNRGARIEVDPDHLPPKDIAPGEQFTARYRFIAGTDTNPRFQPLHWWLFRAVNQSDPLPDFLTFSRPANAGPTVIELSGTAPDAPGQYSYTLGAWNDYDPAVVFLPGIYRWTVNVTKEQ